jgi:hypothetical protein
MSSYPEALVIGALPRDVGAGVRPVAEWAFVRWGVSISHGDLAVIKLTVYEFKYGGALRGSGVELFVYGAAYHLEAGPLEFVCNEEPSV